MFSPIGISTYRRIDHLKRTITALRKNDLAPESDLYIFSDAARAGDEEGVAEVRSYCRNIKGFKSIELLERSTNNRIENNRGGLRKLLCNYGRLIFLEEDIVTAPGFLRFMNEALDFYEKDECIVSISGYAPPIRVPASYQEDIFAIRRFSAWGFGTWANKFNISQFENQRYILDKKFRAKLKENGEDIISMAKMDISGKINALDVKIMLHQAMGETYTIYPRKSLVQNIGHDGSGIHCGKTSRFHHKSLWEKRSGFVFVDGIRPNPMIVKNNRRFRKIRFSILRRALSPLRKGLARIALLLRE